MIEKGVCCFLDGCNVFVGMFAAPSPYLHLVTWASPPKLAAGTLMDLTDCLMDVMNLLDLMNLMSFMELMKLADWCDDVM